jgi:hypothetical protein
MRLLGLNRSESTLNPGGADVRVGSNSAVSGFLRHGCFTLKPDIARRGWHGRKVPKAVISTLNIITALAWRRQADCEKAIYFFSASMRAFASAAKSQVGKRAR